MALIERYERQVKGIKEDALRLTWAMRGGVSYEEVLDMGPEEKSLIAKIAKDNIEVATKTKMPYF